MSMFDIILWFCLLPSVSNFHLNRRLMLTEKNPRGFFFLRKSPEDLMGWNVTHNPLNIECKLLFHIGWLLCER